MDLSIIIVNWNAKEMLKNCLESILKYNSNMLVQIIIVDNSSSDGSKEMLKSLFPEVKVMDSGGNIGFGRANNLAIPNAEAPFVLFLNPDTVVNETVLSEMIGFLTNNPAVGALGCKIRNSTGDIQDVPEQWWITPFRKVIELFLISKKMPLKIKRLIPIQDPNRSGYVSYLYGACLMIRKKTLDQVGGFDDRFFMYCEDIDLCHRIILAGWKLYYLSECEITHLVGGTTKRAAATFKYITTCESISKLMQKYYGKKGKCIYKAGLLLSSCIKLFILLPLLSVKLIKVDDNSKELLRKHFACIKWSIAF